MSTCNKIHFRRDSFPLKPYNRRDQLLRKGFGFDGPQAPQTTPRPSERWASRCLASFSHKGGGWNGPKGMIYIALYWHGIDGIVLVQSTFATLYVGDSVPVSRFTSGR